MSVRDVLAQLQFGQRVAEEEGDLLQTYFVETDHWRRLFAGEIDVVYGPKGSGKSALYFLLLARQGELFDRSILLLPAENPRGAPAFRDLVIDPPATEAQFKGLWKLYTACLLSATLQDYDITNQPAHELRNALQREGLLPHDRNLARLLRSVLDYVRGALKPKAVEAEVGIDPITQLPKGFTGRITFHEPSRELQAKGFRSVDELLANANDALTEAGVHGWLLLDRLDVAFADSHQLEQNALRALFAVYLDLLALKHVHLKVFLRTDIWRRITESGFREASHITRHMTIDWNGRSLLNLVVSRAVQNQRVLRFYHVEKAEALASFESQDRIFKQIFPDQVDVGPNKPSTFDWMLSRTRDGTGHNAPRELIHLLNALRDVQIRRLEIGEAEPEDGRLFSRGAFKDALPEVSRARLEQTLFAEYPTLKQWIEKLRGAKTGQTAETLGTLWGVTREEAHEIADGLSDVGFFERRGSRDRPEYWIPFLYRDALELVRDQLSDSCS